MATATWRKSNGQPADPATVPPCKNRFFETRALPKNDKGFVGFETIFEPWQKEAEYTVPERP